MGIQKSLKREKRENNHNIYMKKQNGAGKYTDLIMKAIDEKPISSLPDIKKWITRNCDYNTSSCKNFRYINKSLKTLVDDGTLVKVKGKWRRPPQKKRPKSAMKKHTAKKANRMPPKPFIKTKPKKWRKITPARRLWLTGEINEQPCTTFFSEEQQCRLGIDKNGIKRGSTTCSPRTRRSKSPPTKLRRSTQPQRAMRTRRSKTRKKSIYWPITLVGGGKVPGRGVKAGDTIVFSINFDARPTHPIDDRGHTVDLDRETIDGWAELGYQPREISFVGTDIWKKRVFKSCPDLLHDPDEVEFVAVVAKVIKAPPADCDERFDTLVSHSPYAREAVRDVIVLKRGTIETVCGGRSVSKKVFDRCFTVSFDEDTAMTEQQQRDAYLGVGLGKKSRWRLHVRRGEIKKINPPYQHKNPKSARKETRKKQRSVLARPEPVPDDMFHNTPPSDFNSTPEELAAKVAAKKKKKKPTRPLRKADHAPTEPDPPKPMPEKEQLPQVPRRRRSRRIRSGRWGGCRRRKKRTKGRTRRK